MKYDVPLSLEAKMIGGSNDYRVAYERSLRDPEGFWAEAAAAISWTKRWDRVLDDSRAPFIRWFAGGVLNTCYNAVDRHVERGRGKQCALIYDSPVTNTVRRFTYGELLNEVAQLAGAIRALGVEKGDRVLIYMPGVPEAVFAMLACARLGAIHSVVFGGFASRELATRIDDARPKAILSASCGIEVTRVIAYKPLLDEAVDMASHKPEHCLILQRPQRQAALVPGRDVDWHDAVARARPADCVPVAATDPLYIHYTSGTTGIPKGVVRDNGGHAVALEWSMGHVFSVGAGEVFWAASDIGWTVGHGYIVYGPLLHGATTILYEGKPVGTPDAGAFWRVCEQHGVNVLFTAPTAFRAIKREDPDGHHMAAHDLSRFRLLFLAGERCDPDTLIWAGEKLGVPVIDHWWQTELGWPAVANCVGLGLTPVKPGSPTLPVPGYDVQVLGDDGREAPPNQIGNLVIRLPLPPGALPTLWQNDEGFVRSYLSQHAGYYLTGDAGYKDADGYVYVMSRVDDIINVAGHRLSTGAIEEVLAGHPAVAECAVIGAADEIKGEVPVGFIVLKAGIERGHALLIAELVDRVRHTIGAFTCFKTALVVKALPKTRSGKILRGTMKKIADGAQYALPATIEDPLVLADIGEQLKTVGYAKT
jgi:propionyl-CoA synthetase